MKKVILVLVLMFALSLVASHAYARIRDQHCDNGKVVVGISADGVIDCGVPSGSNWTCQEGEVVVGINADGVICAPLPDFPICTDNDSDNFYVPNGCGTPVDCNDDNPDINPDKPEICGDGVDNDCDTLIDCNDDDCASDPACNICPDSDGDGYTDGDCGGPDCNDNDPAINPGAEEICGDEVDNDCDGDVDELGCVNPPPNQPPTVPIVTISPDPAYTYNDLTCLGESTDPDANDIITYSYVWVIGEIVPIYVEGDTLSSSYTSPGISIQCNVTADDGTDSTTGSLIIDIQY